MRPVLASRRDDTTAAPEAVLEKAGNWLPNRREVDGTAVRRLPNIPRIFSPATRSMIESSRRCGKRSSSAQSTHSRRGNLRPPEPAQGKVAPPWLTKSQAYTPPFPRKVHPTASSGLPYRSQVNTPFPSAAVPRYCLPPKWSRSCLAPAQSSISRRLRISTQKNCCTRPGSPHSPTRPAQHLHQQKTCCAPPGSPHSK
jgi:hypothetical protein